MRPWLTFPLLFLGLLFLLMPFWIALGDAALWTWYGMGLFWAVVIGLFAGRWLRVTTVERGDDYRVVRLDHLRRRRKRSSEAG
jgi:hypothetical protein